MIKEYILTSKVSKEQFIKRLRQIATDCDMSSQIYEDCLRDNVWNNNTIFRYHTEDPFEIHGSWNVRHTEEFVKGFKEYIPHNIPIGEI